MTPLSIVGHSFARPQQRTNPAAFGDSQHIACQFLKRIFVCVGAIIFSLLFLSSCNKTGQDFPSEGDSNMSTCDSYVGFEFVNHKKYVWVCATKNHVDLVGKGITKGKYLGIDYIVSDFDYINFESALFEHKDKNIVINGLSMENYGTAVVDKHGTVFMGAFIRHFD